MEEKEYYFESDLPKEIYDKKLPMFGKDDFVPDTDMIKMTNPFLYNFKEYKNIVYSIEEFGLVYKKRNIFIGSIVRNEDLSKNTKKRVLRKHFKKCKKEFVSKYKITKKQVIKTNSKEIKNDVNILIKLIIFIVLIVNSFIIGLMNGKINDLIGVEYSMEFINNLESIVSNSTISIVVNFSLYILIFTLLYMNFYSKIINNYNHEYKDNLNNSIKTVDDILSIFKKEYSKTKKYYLTNMDSNIIYCPTIYLDGLWNLDITFNDILFSKFIIEDKNINVVRLSKFNKIILKCMYILIILSNAFTVGLFIFVLLKSIVNKI